MTSDNDGESVSTSGSGRPSPVPGARGGRDAAGCKGILVHNNKKSANTNRVSFVANSCASPSPQSSSAPVHRPPGDNKHRHLDDHHHQRQQQQQQQRRRRGQDDGGPAAAEDLQLPYYGRRLSGFGVKSYLHEFYDDPAEYRGPYPQDDDGDDDDDYDYDDDDFKYCVEPEIRWRRHCRGTYMVLGLAVMTAGAVAMAAGHLIPARDPVVGRSANMEVIDRWAVAYNENLASCRYIGSAAFAVGVVFSVVRFWVSVIGGGGGGDSGGGGGGGAEAKKLTTAADDRTASHRGYGADRQRRRRRAEARQQAGRDGDKRPAVAETVRIPITGSVQNVQPDPRAISLQLTDSS